jgi:hypothetical protein
MSFLKHHPCDSSTVNRSEGRAKLSRVSRIASLEIGLPGLYLPGPTECVGQLLRCRVRALGGVADKRKVRPN